MTGAHTVPRPDRWRPSVTVAAIISRQDADGQERFLLIEEHTAEGLRLNNPAGHLDPAESPEQGAIREALEETARVFTPSHLLGVYLSRFQRAATGEDITYLRLAYAGTVGEPVPGRTFDEGIVRTLWLTLNEVRDSADRHRSPLVLQCIEDLVAGRRYPLQAVTTHPSVLGLSGV
ncbi:MAG: NUDIX hydrolase [Betaproteobacteria bacterium]|jgi:phosphatase NudJ|nr:NUDIX hydrolase [Betaproteobacteria bacterium]NBT10968.1 NUDIX hydrolase [Betaproteobacteria bacterium]NBU50025.1 NUDIX hydrolase [Betaproteobacteria bacterium]NBX95799.1 NUDIX hydrolase [Betaproteobacteria bacterium]